MDQEKQVEVSVVLGCGTFSLSLNGVTINVRVQDTGSGANTLHLEVCSAIPPVKGAGIGLPSLPDEKASDPTAASLLAEERAYVRQASQDIYEGLGRLAKEINLSIQDLSLADIDKTAMASPGERLDRIRSQVSDSLEVAEKTTLSVIDLVEHIQEDCRKLQEQIGGLASDETRQSLLALAGVQDAASLLPQLLTQEEALDQLIRAHFQEAESPEATAAHYFALGDMLQLLWESCATDAVKPHLKSVQAQCAHLFRVDEAEQSLQQLASELPQEDGLYQFPIDKTLESLRAACTDDRVQELFNKLLASAPKIFPMGTLSVKAHQSGSIPEAGLLPEILTRWQELNATIQNLARNTQKYASPPGEAESGDGSEGMVREALNTVERIHTSLSGIIEALALQDLSGQRPPDVLDILRQLQMQVLSLLVAAGNKFRGKEISFTQSEISAQEELNRMLQTSARPSPDPSDQDMIARGQWPLSQEAIHEFLTSMGF
jgi:chemotaxis regulatin CheY-phosphate phosphatase CheZ